MTGSARPVDQAGVLVLLAWAAGVLPRLVQTLTAPKYLTGVGEQAVPYSALATTTNQVLTAATLGWCLLVVLHRLRGLPTDRRTVLVALLAPWLYIAVRDLYAGDRPDAQALLYPFVVGAVWVLRPPLERLALLGYLTGLTAAMSLLLGVLRPEQGLYRRVTGELVAPEKEIFDWGLLVGPFTNGNNLGQYLVLGLPAVLLVRGPWRRALLALTIVAAVLWTSSRSSLAAVAVAAAVAALLAVLPAAGRRAAALGVLGGGAAVVVGLPLLVSDDTTLSNRGLIWRASTEAWAASPVIGLGSQWYATIAAYVGGIADTAFHGHNQAVQVLVVGGLVNVALVLAMAFALAVAAVSWAARGVVYPTVHLAALCVSCALEVSFGFVDRDFLLAVTTVPMAFFALSPRPPAPVSEPTGVPDLSARGRPR